MREEIPVRVIEHTSFSKNPQNKGSLVFLSVCSRDASSIARIKPYRYHVSMDPVRSLKRLDSVAAFIKFYYVVQSALATLHYWVDFRLLCIKPAVGKVA